MILASIESLMGSIWFGLMLGFVGYVAGHVIPISRLLSFFVKK